jgi:3'-phosphoadenosine 5'-phosphosulfate sulfotransferase (PAPS reductase)/FAD synthetase
MLGIDRREDPNNKLYQDLKKGIIPSVDHGDGSWFALLRLNGDLKDKYGRKSIYNKERYKFLLDAPFNVSAKCCDVMKKKPLKKYGKETGRKPILATMAAESRLRAQKWLQHGCNAFDTTTPKSQPMSFWTEQDVLLYIKMNHLPICSVYGDVVEDIEGTEQVRGQMTFSDMEGYEHMELFDAKRLPLMTTGCKRTGCMFCGYGCHLDKSPSRFEMMKQTHPKQYEYIMKPVSEGGLGYKEVIEWINEHGNMNIRY